MAVARNFSSVIRNSVFVASGNNPKRSIIST